MPAHSLLQQILDNWTLVYLFAAFVVICLWVIFGKSKSYQETAAMIFRHEDTPAAAPHPSAPHPSAPHPSTPDPSASDPASPDPVARGPVALDPASEEPRQ